MESLLLREKRDCLKKKTVKKTHGSNKMLESHNETIEILYHLHKLNSKKKKTVSFYRASCHTLVNGLQRNQIKT